MSINISEKSNFIWKIADILRGDFKQSEYGDVILPFTVLCRLDSVLAPTKERVMEIHRKGTFKTECAKLAGFKSITGGLKFYNLNKFPDNETVGKFDTAEYQILIVAEKYQTGFDQPLLHTMYVDNQEMVLRSKNPLDLFKIIYDNTIMDVVLGRMAKNQEFCEKYLEDEEFRREVDKILLPLVHERLSKI